MSWKTKAWNSHCVLWRGAVYERLFFLSLSLHLQSSFVPHDVDMAIWAIKDYMLFCTVKKKKKEVGFFI